MAALTPRTYAAPDDESAFQIAYGILCSNLHRPYNEDAKLIVQQPEQQKILQEEIEEGQTRIQSEQFEKWRIARREQTPWVWDFVNGVRPAWSPVESLILELQNAAIDREELNQRIKQDALRLVTIDLVDFVREDQIRRLKAYSDTIVAALKWNRPTVKQQPESADAAAAQIREALDRLTAPLLIWKEEIEAVYNAVHRVRSDMGKDVLRIGEISGHSASMVFETAIDRLIQYWNGCEDVSGKSAQGEPYTHFEPPVQLFVNKCLKSLPNPNDLSAAVENEYVTTLARLSLIAPIASVTAPLADPAVGRRWLGRAIGLDNNFNSLSREPVPPATGGDDENTPIDELRSATMLADETVALQDSNPTDETPPPILNDILLGILKALDGKAMKVEELAKAVTGGEQSRLYRAGLKAKLEAEGHVKLVRGIGYYRPDKPPLDRVLPAAKLGAKK